MESACRHTTISKEDVIAISAEITQELLEHQARQIKSQELGKMVMRKLQDKDPIAYIRFACVYRRFTAIDELMDELQQIMPK